VKFSAIDWLFVSVTLFAVLVVFTVTLPKSTVLADSVTGATPVPESAENCGLLVAVSITVICPPAVAPSVVGLKSIPIMQFAPPASVPVTTPPEIGQVVTAPVSSTNGPPKRTLVIDKLPPWLFVSVTVFAVLVAPTATLPKSRLDGETAAGTTPVPESVTTCGLLPAVSVIVICPPEVAPRVVGWKKTTKVQLAPGATGTPPVQGEITLGVTTKGPVGIIEVKLRLPDWLFVTVTVCPVLSQPTATLPKSRLAGETVTGATPVPVPESNTTCGLLVPVSVIVICPPEVGPTVVGWKRIWMVQLAPGATGTPPVQGEITLGVTTNGPVGMMDVKLRLLG